MSWRGGAFFDMHYLIIKNIIYDHQILNIEKMVMEILNTYYISLKRV